MLRDEYEHLTTWNIYNAGKTLYKEWNRVKEFYYLKNKQQIMPKNLETQIKHTHMYL